MAGYKFLKKTLLRRDPRAVSLLKELEGLKIPKAFLEGTARDLLLDRESLAQARTNLLLSNEADAYEFEAFSILCCALSELCLSLFRCLWALRQLNPSTLEALAQGLSDEKAELLKRLTDLAYEADFVSLSLPKSFTDLLHCLELLCSALLSQRGKKELLELLSREEAQQTIKKLRGGLLQKCLREKSLKDSL